MKPASGDAPAYDYITFPRQFISYRWFKPLLVALLAIAFMFVMQIFLMIGAAIWSGDVNFIDTVGLGYDDMNPYTGPGALAELGTIAVMLPALALAALIVRDRPWSSYSSSRNGWNWSAFAKCLAVAAVIQGALLAIQLIFFPDEAADGISRFTTAGVVACAIFIPLQSLAEEYVFRGFIMQTIGAWFKLPIIGIIASAVIFAVGHPYNLVGVITIFFNGIIWGFIAWKTKGLEASSAAHIVNNLLAFYLSGFGLQSAGSEVDIPSMAIALAIDAAYAAAVILLGRRFGWFRPKGDGARKFNEKKLAKAALKQQTCNAIPQQAVLVAQHPQTPQRPQTAMYPQPPLRFNPQGMQPGPASMSYRYDG